MVEGQGIPDPWLTRSQSNLKFPFIHRTHSENGNIKKNIFQYLRGERYNGNIRDKPCFCCEKKFLFDCPDKAQSSVSNNAKDKTNLLNCPCLECHGKDKTTPIVSSEHCNCIPIFQNWVVEQPDSRSCKCRERKKRIPSDSSSTISSKYNADEDSSTESLYPSNYLMRYCSCLQSKRKNVCLDYNNVGMPSRLRSRSQKGIFTECNSKNHIVKSFLCPCLLNFKRTQRESLNKSEETNLKISKEVQTDGQPLRKSKIIQTDNTKVVKCKTGKNEQKCSCDVKWVGSNVIHCDSSNPIFNPQTGQSFTMCFSHPSLVCPCRHPSQVLIHHVDHKRKHKKEKRKNCEVDKALQCNLLPTYVREEVESPIRTKPKEVLDFKNYLTRPESGLTFYRPIIESVDYSKYLAEKKLKKFIQEREFPLEKKFDFERKIYGAATDLKRFEDERTALQEKKTNGKVFRRIYHDFESVPHEINYDSLVKNEFHDLNSTRKNVRIEHCIGDSPVNLNFLKQSNESWTSGLVGHCKNSSSQTKKPKKVNRKTRRKPLRVIYSHLKRPQLSKKFPTNHKLKKEIVQPDLTDNRQREVSLKTVSFCAVENNPNDLGGEKTNNLQFLKVEESSPSKKIFHTFTDTRARIEQETRNRHYEWNDQRYLLETFKEPLKSERNFNNILHQITSHNSGTIWSSNTLKNIVDELLLERKTLE